MREAWTRHPIDQHSGRGGTEDEGDPIPPTLTEPEMSKHLKQEWPTDRVKGLCDVHLEKEAGSAPGMEGPCRELDIAKVVVEGSTFDEGTLIGRHKPVKVGRETGSQDLGEQLPKAVDEGLIGRKSLTSTTTSFFGRREMRASLREANPRPLVKKRELRAAKTSDLITDQQVLYNRPVNPSRPGALSEGKDLITAHTSSSENGSSSPPSCIGLRPKGVKVKSEITLNACPQDRSKVSGDELLKLSSCETVSWSPSQRRVMKFFRFQALA